jgi:hypothetical protein
MKNEVKSRRIKRNKNEDVEGWDGEDKKKKLSVVL